MERFSGRTNQWESHDGIELVQLSRVTALKLTDDDAWPLLVVGDRHALEVVLQDYQRADELFCAGGIRSRLGRRPEPRRGVVDGAWVHGAVLGSAVAGGDRSEVGASGGEAVSTYNEFSGIVPLKLGTTKEAVLGAICGAIGAADQELYFPIGDVIECDPPYWRCQQCGGKSVGPDLELATAECACGRGAGRWEAHADPEATAIDFGLIPPEGAHADMVESAMLALAPFVDTSDAGFVEVEMVPGMNWNDAFMYRFVEGHVEISGARLASDGNWKPVEVQPQQYHVQRVHTDG